MNAFTQMTDTIQSSISNLIGKLKPTMRHSNSHNDLSNLGSNRQGNMRPGSSSPGNFTSGMRPQSGLNNINMKKTGVGGGGGVNSPKPIPERPYMMFVYSQRFTVEG